MDTDEIEIKDNGVRPHTDMDTDERERMYNYI